MAMSVAACANGNEGVGPCSHEQCQKPGPGSFWSMPAPCHAVICAVLCVVLPPLARRLLLHKHTLYCLYFLPTSFLESFKETDQPAGRGPLEEMPGECRSAGLPGPLPDGRPGFLFFTSLPDCSSLRFLPGLTSGAESLILVTLSLLDLRSSYSSYA